jgi:hypothetical protein
LYCFYRESGASGTVFVLLFDKEQKTNFQLSNLKLGHGIAKINPYNDSEWSGTTILQTLSPSIEWNVENEAFIPVPFSDTVKSIYSVYFFNSPDLFKLSLNYSSFSLASFVTSSYLK